MTSEVFQIDCLRGMKQYPDGHFDLSCVDPPYGIGLHYIDGFGDRHDKYRKIKYEEKDWNDRAPSAKYFKELYRVSKHQIIWGCNFFNKYINTSGRIVWDKLNDNTERWSHCDIASCSMQNRNTIFRFTWDGFRQGYRGIKEERIHPQQKPIALYNWIFKKYAKPGFKILDTHLGSGSSRIAAYFMNPDFVGFETDKKYFDDQEKRFFEYRNQPVIEELFYEPPAQESIF